MELEALPCFRCGTKLENVTFAERNQPYRGTEFRTYGHYGSTYFDPMNDDELVINICDDCLAEWSHRHLIERCDH